ncbi:MAG TPA: cytochrome c [Aquimonas sp.]|jgi:cytochrome c553|nr:cytochrome c [Xanthomonadales bacterium]TXH11301.1 MAG: cytochrome c [Gammaproteobacteria bacterium]HRD72603.1 cytochrome c [Aquimonas sp.]HRF55155.1 cytochrome c [Aquimonas sp.]
MKSITRIAASLALSAAALQAHAADGDAAKGKDLAYTCTGCHGVTGYKNAYPQYNVPKIGGQNQAYLVAALTAYRAGERSHPTMVAQAQGYTEQDILDIAAYLSSVNEGAAK